VIVGVGIDAVPVERMRRALARTPSIEGRVFTEGERRSAAGRVASLAARFAAKEAVRKALRAVIAWRDIEVVSAPDRSPSVRVAGRDDLWFHVSLTHTDEVAMAVVVAETR